MQSWNYLKVIILINTTPSKPDDSISSFSDGLHAFQIQRTEGIYLATLLRLRLDVPAASRRGKNTS